ncbi:MAG: TIGR02757 family protein [Acidobacteriota bacterium]
MPRFAAGRLRRHLDSLYRRYGAGFLDTDPISFPHRYDGDEDREIVAFLSAALAYGRVAQIRESIERLTAILGPRPAAFVRGFDPRRDGRRLEGFAHRFNDAHDMGLLLWYLKQILGSHGAIEAFFLDGYDASDGDVGPALASFVGRMLHLDCSPYYRERRLPRSAGVRFFLPSPEAGSCCKRLNLFLRWMVRRSDGVDFGIWKHVSPAKLVIPLDTHVSRIASYIGLTHRRSIGWKMALEVTDRLRSLDPDDPIKYDFALCRLGILDECPRLQDPFKCRCCSLRPVCSLP